MIVPINAEEYERYAHEVLPQDKRAAEDPACQNCEGFRPEPQRSGNLQVDREIDLPSPGMNVEIAHYYNAASLNNGPFGYGRQLSTNLTGFGFRFDRCRDTDLRVLQPVFNNICNVLNAPSFDPNSKALHACLSTACDNLIGPRRATFDECQSKCSKDYCKTGTIKCNDNRNCCAFEAPDRPGACSGITSCKNSSPRLITVCTMYTMPALNHYKWLPGFGCDSGKSNRDYYPECKSPKCPGNAAVFYMLHELQHACSHADENKGTERPIAEPEANTQACCLLDTFFASPFSIQWHIPL